MSQKALLMILDGWGMTQNPKVSAVAQAKTPLWIPCHMSTLTLNYSPMDPM